MAWRSFRRLAVKSFQICLDYFRFSKLSLDRSYWILLVILVWPCRSSDAIGFDRWWSDGRWYGHWYGRCHMLPALEKVRKEMKRKSWNTQNGRNSESLNTFIWGTSSQPVPDCWTIEIWCSQCPVNKWRAHLELSDTDLCLETRSQWQLMLSWCLAAAAAQPKLSREHSAGALENSYHVLHGDFTCPNRPNRPNRPSPKPVSHVTVGVSSLQSLHSLPRCHTTLHCKAW